MNGDLWRVALLTHYQSHQGVNVLGYVETSNNPGKTPSPAAVATAVEAVIAPKLRLCMSTLASYDGTTAVRRVSDYTASAEGSSIAQAGKGLWPIADEGIAPGQLTGLIRKYTDRAGRRGIGRMYLPFPPATFYDNETFEITGDYKLKALGVADVIQDPITFAEGGINYSLAPCLLNLVIDPPPAPPVLEFARLTDARVRNGVATQRRRGFYGSLWTNSLQ